MQLLGNTILIEELSREERISGIYIPDTKENAKPKGKVLSIGRGLRMVDGSYKPIKVEVGDVVLYNPMESRQIFIQGKQYFLIADDYVWVRFPEEDEN